jgi:hypothetical protein
MSKLRGSGVVVVLPHRRRFHFVILIRAVLPLLAKNSAVRQSAGVQFSGFVAWLVWALIHIQLLAETSLRFSVFLQWAGTYLSGKRGARLMIRQRSGRWVKSKGLLYDDREGNLHGSCKRNGQSVGTVRSDDGQINLKLDRSLEMAVKGMAPTRNHCLPLATQLGTSEP